MNESEKCVESFKPQRSCEKSPEDLKTANLFRDLWRKTTDDNNLTLYGFRRFRTTHLLNLRYLEEEIDLIDHQIYQAGLKLERTPTSVDRLGLRHGRIDASALGHGEVMTRELVLRMRELVRQYGALSFATSTVCWLTSLIDRRGLSRLQQSHAYGNIFHGG